MELGDFTQLAQAYKNRTGYSLTVLQVIQAYIEKKSGPVSAVADVGAGTGKLTENLAQLGLRGFAVEPNDAMREGGSASLLGRQASLGPRVWQRSQVCRITVWTGC